MANQKGIELNLMLKAFDGMSNVVRSACIQSDAEFDKLNKKLDSVADGFDKYGKKAAVMGGALLGASALNLKMAGDFEQGMNNVSTLIDTNTENLDEMSKKVLEIGKKSPKSLSDLTDGLYAIRSAGISAADQFNVLKGSEKLAVAGLSTTAEAVDIATSAINAFNLKGQEQNKIYDMFFKVVKYGKTNVSEFAQGFGSVAGVVSSAGIKLDEYSASVAAMTTSGVKAANAHTQLKAAVAGLSRGSKDQVKIFNKLGAKSFGDLIKKSGGMVNAFNRINKAVGGNQSKLIGLVGSVEGYNAILSLTGAQNKTYIQALNEMRYGVNALDEGYQKQMSGLNNQLNSMKNQVQALAIRFGNGLLPVFKNVADIAGNLSNAFDKMPDGLVNFISIATAGTGALLLFGGTATMALGGIIRNVILIRKVLRGFSIASWANPALLPVLGITAAVVGLGAAAVFCYNKFEGFRNVCQGTWAVIQATGAWLAVLWNGFLNCASAVLKFISPAVKFGLTILKWTTPIGWAITLIQKLCGWIGNLIQKAGGLRGIGEGLKNWAKGANTQANEINNNIKAQRESKKVDGSHATGLNRVPFDGYIGELHKDETILSANEADTWRSLKTSNFNSLSRIQLNYNPKIEIKGDISQIQDIETKFLQLLKTHKDDIYRMLQSLSARREARSY